jgi:hypothetical protein
VWLLDGPTPILNISNTEIGSYDKKDRFYKNKLIVFDNYKELQLQKKSPAFAGA